MSDIIKLLPDHVANQIAAGEVVQRPASVVKELLENAIDAKAKHIKLVIKEAGKILVQVIDNGIGMSVTDARLCFERHATSKISKAEDLFKLHTKGFRGEALASIAAIAHVELKTKPEALSMGNHIIIEGSKIISQEAAVCPNGTTISVKNLFYNIPARRNFLKSNTVELRHIIDEFHRIALAHPSIAFNMFNNGEDLFSLPVSNLRQRIVAILGAKTNDKLVPVSEETEIASISGFIVKPEFARKSRGQQFFFVNDRFIKSHYLNHAVSAAFEGLMKEGHHPGYFLFLNVDPQSIDINIHPTKTEIKFEDEQALYAILRATIKHSLGQFNVSPVLDFNRDANLDTPYSYNQKEVKVPGIEINKNFNPFIEDIKSSTKRSQTTTGSTSSWESLYVGLGNKDNHELIDINEIEMESEDPNEQLFDPSTTKNTKKTLQLKNKYIISTIKNGVLLIHRQRAHERILYEELLRYITVKEGLSQQLLFPLTLEFSKAELLSLNNIKEPLESMGFIFKSFSETAIELSGIPTQVSETSITELFESLLADLQNEMPDAILSQGDALARSMAKNLAIKSGMPSNSEADEQLINQLFGCKEPNTSPTNKTVFITLGLDELDKKFM